MSARVDRPATHDARVARAAAPPPSAARASDAVRQRRRAHAASQRRDRTCKTTASRRCQQRAPTRTSAAMLSSDVSTRASFGSSTTPDGAASSCATPAQIDGTTRPQSNCDPTLCLVEQTQRTEIQRTSACAPASRTGRRGAARRRASGRLRLRVSKRLTGDASRTEARIEHAANAAVPRCNLRRRRRGVSSAHARRRRRTQSRRALAGE